MFNITLPKNRCNLFTILLTEKNTSFKYVFLYVRYEDQRTSELFAVLSSLSISSWIASFCKIGNYEYKFTK